MKAGMELDALIAERVMGCNVWKKSKALQETKDQQEYEKVRNSFYDFKCDCKFQSHFDSDDLLALMRYSTDIAKAWRCGCFT